jgi:selenocysteine lyase/cysteine desulfurase
VCARSTDAHALVDSLAEERIICSLRDQNLRIALHFYNTADDVERVLGALAERREYLA